MGFKQPLYATPAASTDFTREAKLCGDVLRYGFLRGDADVNGALRFYRIQAIRHRAESLCTAWHIEGVYDTLVEVINSSWIDEIESEFTLHERATREFRALHHYMIYLDSVGCFEFLAHSWQCLPEEAT